MLALLWYTVVFCATHVFMFCFGAFDDYPPSSHIPHLHKRHKQLCRRGTRPHFLGERGRGTMYQYGFATDAAAQHQVGFFSFVRAGEQ